MITDMTTSVPVINTAHLERRNIHFLSFGQKSLKQGDICQNNTKQLCVCTKQCKNVSGSEYTGSSESYTEVLTVKD